MFNLLPSRTMRTALRRSARQAGCTARDRPLRAITPIRPYSSSSTSRLPPKRKWPFPLGLSLALLPGLYWFLGGSKPTLNPQLYSTQKISDTQAIAPSHKLVSIPIPSSSSDLFKTPFKRDGSTADAGEIVVQHMMIGAPDIQIERPYTPVNDPVADGDVKMVVKRVRGGEVGRLVHSLQQGSSVEVRGPIPTFDIKPQDFDRIVMVSTGTGVAPFLQLLSRIPPSPAGTDGPSLHLVHLRPNGDRDDWAVSSGMIPALQEKFGDKLVVHRPAPAPIAPDSIRPALANTAPSDRVMVLVCLPPHLMVPLCGGLTRTLDQGPLTGVLADLGLKENQVWKLE